MALKKIPKHHLDIMIHHSDKGFQYGSKKYVKLLLMLIKRGVRRSWSFSRLATMIRILMMYYVNYKSILEYPEKDWNLMIEEAIRPPNHLSLYH